MSENMQEREPVSEEQTDFEQLPWQEQLGISWKTPLGLFGVGLTTICFTLLILGLFAHITGLIQNQYATIVTILVFPLGMLFGLVFIPISYYIRRHRWFKNSLSRSRLIIDFGNKIHRRLFTLFLVLSVINLAIFSLVVYEGYQFTDSNFFCGEVCHTVMAPEYTAYQRSPHARVQCVECHIGSGAKWYVKAKISGLRQVWAVITGDYHRPIPTPVQNLRPARDTCEACHWPDKFHGKQVKKFISYTNDDQKHPQIEEIALHIGGRNPYTGAFEGIHWHVSQHVKVEYYALNEKRTAIGKVKVTRPNGVTEVFDIAQSEKKVGKGAHWRTMDCIDCHNRPTHVFDELDRKIDLGFYTKKLNADLPGLRADAFTVLQTKYASRAEAKEKIARNLMALQAKRSGDDFVSKNEAAIVASGNYLVSAYLANVWPKMNVTWGTYKSDLGHRNADAGYGCWRCHDDEHATKYGKTISQDCSLCHDEP